MPPRMNRVGEEEEQYATPPHTQDRGGRHRSRGRSPTPRPVLDSTSSDSAATPVGIPGEPPEAGESPETVSSTGTLGSTPLDREQADELATPTQRQYIRLREHVKKTRSCLLDEVTMREALDDKLGSRIAILNDAVALQHETIYADMVQMRLDLQAEFQANRPPPPPPPPAAPSPPPPRRRRAPQAHAPARARARERAPRG